MKWDEKGKEYDARTNIAMGQYIGMGQGPKYGKLKSSYMDEVPQKSHTSKSAPGEFKKPPKKVG